ncbi:ATP-binding protein [Actinoplanes sp. M2I2]|uniref:sensor histidine kinase n=1 Tax=Actinoplanes sp. M2I2 TaxID=1734444 RepID=UPI0027DF7978|nr:ATP-binding protein [Actinoplanes sp. M2I2]
MTGRPPSPSPSPSSSPGGDGDGAPAPPARAGRDRAAAGHGRRVAAGFAVTLLGLPALTAVVDAAGLELAGGVILFLAAVVGVALLGGLWPALLAAVGGFLLLNYFFTAPVRSLDVSTREGALALAVFVLVALAVSWIVDLAARRTRQAVAAAADAHILAAVAGGVLAGPDPLRGLLGELRELFGLDSVALLERAAAGRSVVAASPDVLLKVRGATASPAHQGGPNATAPPAGETGSPQAGHGVVSPSDRNLDPDELVIPAGDGLVLALRGRPLDDNEQTIARAFGAQAAVALRQQRLATAAEGDRVRSALLAAVSHDLRTPLASAKAAVAGLRSDGVHFDEDDRRELLATADESLDRLAALLANLLDLSRLEAGALAVHLTDVGLEDVVPAALDELGPAGRRITVRLPDDLPAARADPGLLDRVLVNVVGNALRYSPADRPPEITGGTDGDRVQLRVVDHGPGVPPGDRERIFQAFQRLGDRDNHTGVGLGLALSRGLTEAMDGTLTPQETPGGGLTMVLTLPMGTM